VSRISKMRAAAEPPRWKSVTITPPSLIGESIMPR
jgi:hypothetical protein